MLRAEGHEPVALLCVRHGTARYTRDRRAPRGTRRPSSTSSCPSARDRIAPLLRLFEPDVGALHRLSLEDPAGRARRARGTASSTAIPSLLPRYRGPSPVSWAIRNGETEIGFTFHYMDAELDTGTILGQVRVPLDDEHSWEELEPKLAQAVGGLLPGRPRARRRGRSRRPPGRERGELPRVLRAASTPGST